MLISPAKIVQESTSRGSWDNIDPVVVMLRAMGAGETPIVAVHSVKCVRTQL